MFSDIIKKMLHHVNTAFVLSQRLVHDISKGDDDDDHPTNKTAPNLGVKRKADVEQDSAGSTAATASTSNASPPKRAKMDDTDEEKIKVEYGKKKTVGPSTVGGGAANQTDCGAAPKADETDTGNKATGATPQCVSKKEKCRYWDKCYQTNKAHKDEYCHPGDGKEDHLADQPETNPKPKKAHISSHINVNLLLAHKYDEK